MTSTNPAQELPVFNFTANLIATEMVSSAIVSIGPGQEAPATPANPGPPILAKGICPAGTSTNTHYHPGYYVRTFIEGSYRMDGVDYTAGDVVLAERCALTGEEGPLGTGSVELCFFESTYAATPFFLDTTDPRLSDFLDKMASQFEEMKALTPPGADEAAQNLKLDHERDQLDYDGFIAFPCQLGPQGFGVEPKSDDASRYAILVHFKPSAILADRQFASWAMAVVFEGVCAINSKPHDLNEAVSFPPQTPVRFEIGGSGAKAMLYFSNGADAAAFLSSN
jgi:hypothetical protein